MTTELGTQSAEAGRHGSNPRHLTRWMRLLAAVGRYLRHGSIRLVMPDGEHLVFQGTEPGPEAVIIVRDQDMARRTLVSGGLGFGEAYLDGQWDTPDLAVLLEVANRNDQFLEQFLYGKPWARVLRRVVHAFNRNSKAQARKNIAYHYDLGNAFYTHWLDPSMTYSSARFEPASLELQDAQKVKYQGIVDRLRPTPDTRILEIGCGWGGFAEHVARETGCRVTGITISREQHDFARRRIFEAGLAEKVEIRLQDYRDVPERFDRVASIEMFEAVGEAYWPTFFAALRDRLAPGGVAALQVITIADRYFENYRRGVDFIQRYVFPGGMLPSPSVFRQHTDAAGLAWRGAEAFGQDYARTLAIWRERFIAAWPDIQPLGFDERFKRLWQYYLAYCEAGFRTGSIDVMQVSLARP
jgi:cyclopropane-fatty-acyl-phospholipid synthase